MADRRGIRRPGNTCLYLHGCCFVLPPMTEAIHMRGSDWLLCFPVCSDGEDKRRLK